MPRAGQHDPAYAVADFDGWPEGVKAVLPDQFPVCVRSAAHYRADGATGDFISDLMMAQRPWDCPAEADFMRACDVNPYVWAYWVQCARVYYRFEGRERYTVPDVLVRFAHGGFGLYEIKPQRKLDREKARLDAIGAACKDLGLTYQRISHEAICSSRRMANIETLNRSWSARISDETVRLVADAVTEHRPATLRALLDLPCTKGIGEAEARACALRGAFHIDLEQQPLDYRSPITPRRPGLTRLLKEAERPAGAEGGDISRRLVTLLRSLLATLTRRLLPCAPFPPSRKDSTPSKPPALSCPRRPRS
ncbi:hypothetical protein VQH23_12790 [Pararoseomonas sp. SCSIO 73927]|uniref:hypothetical protein n=1 Tax=Pararoseomonas sp. SCSIO 73927 TaxID=3114537 RepID=UPI0030CC7416